MQLASLLTRVNLREKIATAYAIPITHVPHSRC